MSTAVYGEVLSQVQNLRPGDKLRLLEDLTTLVRREIAPQPRRSILELRGLGKHIWQGLDVRAYIEEERASWNG